MIEGEQMYMIESYKENLEDNIDICKISILSALVKEKVIEKDVAEKWCEEHTIILRDKSIFRTLSDKWFNSNKEKSPLMIVVKKV